MDVDLMVFAIWGSVAPTQRTSVQSFRVEHPTNDTGADETRTQENNIKLTICLHPGVCPSIDVIDERTLVPLRGWRLSLHCLSNYVCLDPAYPNSNGKHPWQQGLWGQHGAQLGPTGPRWAPYWSHEPCYLGHLGWDKWSPFFRWHNNCVQAFIFSSYHIILENKYIVMIPQNNSSHI